MVARTLALILVVLAPPAEAQEVIVGLAASGDVGPGDTGLRLPRSLQVAASFPLSEVVALEPYVSVARVQRTRRSESQGLYGVQFRRRVAEHHPTRSTLFVTGGFGGYYDGRAMRPPVATSIGVAATLAPSSSMALRTDLQLVNLLVVPMTLRAVVSVSIAIGRRQ